MSLRLEQPAALAASPYEQLLDYKRRVHSLYRRVRESRLDAQETSSAFRKGRDVLFATHPQSALNDARKALFRGLDYYDYDPKWRFTLAIDTNVEPSIIEMELHDDGPIRLRRFGKLCFEVDERRISLSVYWIMGYGGGLFLPFRDLTSGSTTYGGGRYVLDTVKHADLGHDGPRLIVDFNYAYNPSCAYDTRWSCPLPPEENRLPVAIPAGERRFPQ